MVEREESVAYILLIYLFFVVTALDVKSISLVLYYTNKTFKIFQ